MKAGKGVTKLRISCVNAATSPLFQSLFFEVLTTPSYRDNSFYLNLSLGIGRRARTSVILFSVRQKHPLQHLIIDLLRLRSTLRKWPTSSKLIGRLFFCRFVFCACLLLNGVIVFESNAKFLLLCIVHQPHN
jgi:hypothetical protein